MFDIEKIEKAFGTKHKRTILEIGAGAGRTADAYLSIYPDNKYIICDITKKRLLKNKIKKYFTYVVNLGGHVDHSDKKKTFESHYAGCKNLTEVFLNKFPKAFIQMGSSVEYGNLKSPQKENRNCKVKFIKSIHVN